MNTKKESCVSVDDKTLKEIKSGDNSAFEKFFKNNFSFVKQFMRKRINNDPDTVKDLAMKSFEKLFSVKEDIIADKKGNFSSFFVSIMHSVIIDHYRYNNRRSEDIVNDDDTYDLIFYDSNCDENVQDQSLQLDNKIIIFFIKDEINKFKGSIRKDVLIKNIFEEKGPKEISDNLGINVNSVKTHICRGKEKLRKRIEKRW